MINENLSAFYGRKVHDFESPGDIASFARAAPRIRTSNFDDPRRLCDFLGPMLDEPKVQELVALVFGVWNQHGAAAEETPEEAIELLVTRRASTPNLEALFLGDIVSEENEISWINQGDLSSIWGAFPKLKQVVVRGANGLRLGQINHAALDTLILQSGGLPAPVVREALSANAPIKHFELWLGEENYGANTSVEDFSELLAGELFPELKTLGLCNCEYADHLAEALATAPVLDRIEVLDISKSILTDRGANALARSGRLSHLKKLDISYHYVSPEGVAALQSATPTVDASDPQQDEQHGDEIYRNVAVSE